MIFDKELVVPDKYNATQLKDRVRGTKGVTPFNIEALRAKETKAKAKVKVGEGAGPVWDPVIEGHVASPARKPQGAKPPAARRLLQVTCYVTAFPPISPDCVPTGGEGPACRTAGPFSRGRAPASGGPRSPRHHQGSS